jgi:hypothetical protein
MNMFLFLLICGRVARFVAPVQPKDMRSYTFNTEPKRKKLRPEQSVNNNYRIINTKQSGDPLSPEEYKKIEKQISFSCSVHIDRDCHEMWHRPRYM